MLDDYSPSSLERQLWYQDLRLRLQRASDLSSLTPEDRADLDIVNVISLASLELQSIQNFRHNPTLYVELIGNALYTPFILEYTEQEQALRAHHCRLHAIPRLLLEARQNLTTSPRRYGSKVAIGENDDNIALIAKEMRDSGPT